MTISPVNINPRRSYQDSFARLHLNMVTRIKKLALVQQLKRDGERKRSRDVAPFSKNHGPFISRVERVSWGRFLRRGL